MINEREMHVTAVQAPTVIEEAVGNRTNSSAFTHLLRLPRNPDTNVRAASATGDGLIFLLLLITAAVVLYFCSKRSRHVSPVDEETPQEEEEEEHALPGPHIDANTRMYDIRTFHGWVRASNTAARAAEAPGQQGGRR